MASAAVASPAGGAVATVPVTSAAGVLALLEEDDERLQAYALQQVAAIVDEYWAEVCDAVVSIEALSEDPEFPQHELAALVASKVFFHVEEYADALRLALAAGAQFNVDGKTEYVETMISKCIDSYIEQRNAPASDGVTIDPRLEDVVNRMFTRCFSDGEWEQAVGIALESGRLDMVEESISRSDDKPSTLAFTFDAALRVVASRATRTKVLTLLVRLYRAEATPDYFNLVRGLQFLNDAKGVADVLAGLVGSSSETQHLVAYQAGFDLVENQNQQFQHAVAALLPKRRSAKEEPKAADADAAGEDGEGDAAAAAPATATTAPASDGAGVDDDDDDDDGEGAEYWARVEKLRNIVLGTTSVDLYVDFLCKNNHADVQILKDIKEIIPARNSVLHHATVVSHGFMLCGTTCDRFLLENLEWLKRANNWARFSVTAGQGAVHKGHVTEAMKVLEPYLPKEGAVTSSPYLEGGALYALGLIHANQGNKEVLEYLRNALRNTQNSVLQHGATLGIGLAALATAEDSIYAQMREVMFNENANAGEGAGMAIGLLLAGAGTNWTSEVTGESAVSEMLTYARETRHEKCSRGIGIGLALMCYGQEDAAGVLLDQMCRDKDAIIRYGGMHAVGMAYAGTANNAAVRRLLHVAVSDVSDDVRRAAVINLGFVLLSTPEQVPQLVALLAESYNPHVRYGACMAVGISSAGTASRAAIALLEPLCKDKVDFVRQGALMALAMVLQQQNDTCAPAKAMRARLSTIVGEKTQPIMAKMGAILAAGILDAGGRNCVIALRSRAGFRKMSAIVGMSLWLQHWYWYPCFHMLSLALAPTAVIGLNKDLKMPRGFELVCNAPPSDYAYPPFLEPKKEEKKQRVDAVELSTTAKAKAKARRKEKEAGGGKESEDTDMADADKDAAKDGDKDGGKDGDKDGDKEGPEEASKDTDMTGADEGGDGAGSAGAGAGAGSGAAATGGAGAGAGAGGSKTKVVDKGPFRLKNPSRVTYSQAQFVAVDLNQRYRPIRTGVHLGAVLLTDSTPDEDEDVADIKPPPAQTESTEPEPPEPFEWIPN